MGKVAIDMLEVGMKLASDVHDRSGRMLLGIGAELTQKHLLIFRTWGVIEADIEGVGDTDSDDLLPADMDPALLAATEVALKNRFRHVDTSHPAMHELLKLAAIREVKHGNV